jgi:GNAT superfamily N-acetyltransferase
MLFIDEFLLVPSHRGRRWGRAALNFVEDAARAAGFAPSIWRSSAQTPEPKRFTCDPDISVTSTV